MIASRFSGGVIWWIRELRIEERVDGGKLLSILDNISLSQKSDTLQWIPSKGSYSTHVCYHNLQSKGTHSAIWEKIWNLKIPPKL